MRITTDASARALEVERQRRERVRREARERARAARLAVERDQEMGGTGGDELGVEESKGDEARTESNRGRQDWEECICELSGLPYYYSPSRQRSSWTAHGTSREEEIEFDDFMERRSSAFGSVNPMHGDL